MIVEAVSTGEVSLMLRLKLGTLRTNWNDFLSDCIRGKTNLCGRTLLPVARVKAPGDRVKRPFYSLSEVKAFIAQYLETHVVSPADTALKKISISIDPDHLALPPAMRPATIS